MPETNSRAQHLRAAGYKLTNARLTVLQVLEQSDHHHLTSTEVVEAVAAIRPSVGRASVFRTLDLLTRLGIIRPTYIDTGMTPSYVLLPDGHHHHIICMRCRKLIEFNDCGLSGLSQQLEREFDVELTGHLLEFYGLCRDCRDNPPQKPDKD
jgi:Fur family transcriptional regulator, ferric uptake regulator